VGTGAFGITVTVGLEPCGPLAVSPPIVTAPSPVAGLDTHAVGGLWLGEDAVALVELDPQAVRTSRASTDKEEAATRREVIRFTGKP
jgi:hypothetical protein